MSIDLLRTAAFVAYLAAWVLFALAWLAGIVLKRGVGSALEFPMPVAVGTLLQGAAAFGLTLMMSGGALRPSVGELVGVLVLAPLGSWLFVWGMFSRPDEDGLVTGGAFGWVRHPMYLAFLLMLLATGLVISAGWKVGLAVAVYLVGSEMRVGWEEAALGARFGERYEEYRKRVRWRYLPGLR